MRTLHLVSVKTMDTDMQILIEIVVLKHNLDGVWSSSVAESPPSPILDRSCDWNGTDRTGCVPGRVREDE